MKTVPAPFPALGFDTVMALDAAHAAGLKAAGMSFAIRYLGSITAPELQVILDAGLLFMPVTFSRGAGWAPTSGMGLADGERDVAQLQALNVPKGCTVWVDLEGVDPTAGFQAVSDWINTRAAILRRAGYDAGLYVGAGDVLNSAELYGLMNIDRYWRSLSQVPEPSCGFSLLQLPHTITLAGVEIDVDCVQYDFQGRLPTMVGSGG